MASDVIVDTCVWVNFFNQPHSMEKQTVDRLIDDERAAVVGPILTEVIQGCANPSEAQWVASLLGGLKTCMVTDELWKRAGLLGLDLRRNSVILPLSDLVIAAVAIHHGMEVYSTDPHFQQIPGLRLFAG